MFKILNFELPRDSDVTHSVLRLVHLILIIGSWSLLLVSTSPNLLCSSLVIALYWATFSFDILMLNLFMRSIWSIMELITINFSWIFLEYFLANIRFADWIFCCLENSLASSRYSPYFFQFSYSKILAFPFKWTNIKSSFWLFSSCLEKHYLHHS